MNLSFVLVIACVISVTLGANPIKVHADSRSNQWYYSLFLENIEQSMCGGATVSSVQLKESSGSYRGNDQYYYESAEPPYHRYAWNSPPSSLPVSVKIVLSSGVSIELTDVITDFNADSIFIGDEGCGGTLAPTAPSVAPTTGAPTAPTTAHPTAESICVDADPSKLDWRSYDNEIKLNGNRFNMKGLSWFGYETPNNGLYGLDKHSEDWYFQFMKDNGFNAMRLPFAGNFLFSGTSLNSGNFAAYKATIQNAQNYGIFVMPDYHSLNIGSWTDGLNTINKGDAILQWTALANGLKDEWNVFIADIFNEPHDVGNGEWGTWIEFNENAAAAIWSTGVNWMIGVEGTNHECSQISCSWGENLEGVRDKGITFDLESHGANRFVWAQHVYGADVTGNGYSTAAWKAHWGYLFDGTTPSNRAAGLIGEFGTRYTGGMVQWLDDLVDYLITIDQRNTFFWCLNPNSGDTGGLLADDWTTPMSGKLAALHTLQPNPSVVEYDSANGQVCIQFEGGSGSMATPSPTTTTTPAPTTTKTPTKATTKTPTKAGDTLPPTTTATTTTKAPTTGGGSGGNDGNIKVSVDSASQAYYLQLVLSNIDASECYDSIDAVYYHYYTADSWIENSNYYNDASKGAVFDWNYVSGYPTFTEMLPLSIKIKMTSGKVITMTDLVSSLSGTYTSGESICSSTPTTTTTPAPTSMPNLQFENCAGASASSYKAKLIDFPSTSNFQKIWIRDASTNSWRRGSMDSTGCYVFTSGNPYTLPLDVKVKADGMVIKVFDIITSFNAGTRADLNDNFGQANSAAYLDDELESTESGNTSVETAAIIAVICIIICIIGGFIIYYVVRKRRNKAIVSTDDDQDGDLTPNNDVQLTTTDGIQDDQTNIIAIQEEDIDDQ